MLLSVKERLVLSMVMEPQAGRFDALKLVRKFREDLSFSEEEIKEINLRENDQGNGLVWDFDKQIEKDVSIGEVVFNMIKKQFQKLDKEEKLLEDHLDIFEKFVNADASKSN